MGCCLGRSGASDSDDMENAITIGKNRPLIHERIKWKSDVPMTEGQLCSKRDEFWETAPAFEGRKEIWDALRAASALAEQGDYALSQAILDGANVSLPDGTLRESYDELGNRYQVPYYCLSAPTNLVEEHSSESSGATANGDGPHTSAFTDRSGSSAIGGSGGSNALGELQTLKLRLSTTGEDISVDCHSRETVHMVKQRLRQTLADSVPVANQQRWFYGGRVLMDKMRIGDCRIPQNFVVQVVIHNNNGKSGNEDSTTKQDSQAATTVTGGDRPVPIAASGDRSIAADQSTIDTMVVTAKKESVDDSAKKENEKSVDSVSSAKTPVQIHSSSMTGSSKEQSSPLPNSALLPTSIGRSGHDGGASGSDASRRTGSSSSRRSHGKQHQRGKKLRSHQPSSGSTTSTTATTTAAAANGTNSTSVLRQQRCNSFNSKRSNESPTPVETS